MPRQTELRNGGHATRFASENVKTSPKFTVLNLLVKNRVELENEKKEETTNYAFPIVTNRGERRIPEFALAISKEKRERKKEREGKSIVQVRRALSRRRQATCYSDERDARTDGGGIKARWKSRGRSSESARE